MRFCSSCKDGKAPSGATRRMPRELKVKNFVLQTNVDEKARPT